MLAKYKYVGKHRAPVIPPNPEDYKKVEDLSYVFGVGEHAKQPPVVSEDPALPAGETVSFGANFAEKMRILFRNPEGERWEVPPLFRKIGNLASRAAGVTPSMEQDERQSVLPQGAQRRATAVAQQSRPNWTDLNARPAEYPLVRPQEVPASVPTGAFQVEPVPIHAAANLPEPDWQHDGRPLQHV